MIILIKILLWPLLKALFIHNTIILYQNVLAMFLFKSTVYYISLLINYLPLDNLANWTMIDPIKT